MTEMICSSVIDRIVEKISSLEMLKIASTSQINTDINDLHKTLTGIAAVLKDAEDKQSSNTHIKIWLTELRDIAYDVEDIIDEFKFESLRQEQQQASSSKLPRVFNAFNPHNVAFNLKMKSDIDSVRAKLHEIVNKKNDFNLREEVGGSSDKLLKRLESTSLVDESVVFGRVAEKEEIIEMLLNNGGGALSVIPIVGMGGVGKTTLAQIVYNDSRIGNCFDYKSWCCVSEDFDVVRITKTILQGVTLEGFQFNDLNLLQVTLRERLMGKKFLIVLDDVWNEKYDDWMLLRLPFLVGCTGSKIIVTTRSQGVAAITGTVPGLFLKELSDDDCLSLLASHALRARSFDDCPNLKEIGEKLVQKCGRLPLAVKTLGGLLRTKSDREEWEKVLNSQIWDLPEHKSGIVSALRLSYNYLPSHLKQLFSFCAIFSRGYEFYQEELVLLWMAEGFLPQPGGRKQMEDLDSYFNELVSRSFFQRSSSEEPRFVMHDLINDLAHSIFGEMCINLNDKLESNKLHQIPETTRHLSFARYTYEVWNRFKDLVKLKNLRTFISLPILMSHSAARCYLSYNVLYELLPKLRRLRVLSLSGYDIAELPDSISNLKHLRYLNLSGTKIRRLPESLCGLFYLETLILRGCSKLTELPQGIGNLINLCHLDIRDTCNLQVMLLQIGNLTSLQTLSKFIMGKGDGHRIRELKELKNLQGKLSIMGLHNVAESEHAVDANLQSKKNLVGLELEWSHEFQAYQDEERQMHVFESLQPYTSLKELKVAFYGGMKFPYWLGHPSFVKLVKLKLSFCRKCTSLPPLGNLPSLGELFIERMDEIKNVNLNFYGDGSPLVKCFPSLKSLKFKDMLKWEQWDPCKKADAEGETIFPCLRKLTLWNCPKLIGKLPSCLPSLVKLKVDKCAMLEDLPMSLPLLDSLKLGGNEMMPRRVDGMTSLTTLKIRNVSEITCLHDQSIQPLKALKILVISNCRRLSFLCQTRIGLENLFSLKHIAIKDCPKFVSLVEDDSDMSCSPADVEFSIFSNREQLECRLHSMISFKDLFIESCPKLVSFSGKGLLFTLRRLALRNCHALKSLPDGMMMSSSQSTMCPLEDLEIDDCPSLECFPGGKLPTTLKMLKIRYCTKLQSLPEGIIDTCNDISNISHLEHLEIVGCPSLTFFPPGKLPIQLKTLKISDCLQVEPPSKRMRFSTTFQYTSMLKSTNLARLLECVNSLSHLTELYLSDFSCLTSFPVVDLSLPCLRTLNIFNCVNLKSLPNRMQNLTSLQELAICGCPALHSFLKVDLPPNLTSLEIWDCGNSCGMISEWNLKSLSCLKDFSIAGGCFSHAVSFPDETCLPSSLVSLCIGRLPNLESLSMHLQTLTALEELEIFDCPKLRCLPRECLPPLLGRFSARDCPLLKQQSLKEKGVFWHMIAHIPCIEMDGKDD